MDCIKIYSKLCQGDETSFGHTTISNLPANHSVLWVHIVLGIMFMPLGTTLIHLIFYRTQDY
jgi:hypothetical protein